MSTVGRYGKFIEEEGCFQLTAEPPRKWRNIHYNQVADVEMYAEVSNLGDGPTRIREADGTTVQLVGYDSKFLYIHDDETGVVFCPGGGPTPTAVEDHCCKYWPAKTELSSTCNDLRANWRIFVPRTEPIEAWTLTLNNLSDRPRKVSLFAYAMFQLTGCDKDGKGVWKENLSEVHPEIGGVYAYNRHPSCPTDRFRGYLIALNDFAAANGYRDHFTRGEFCLSTPRILWGWNCDNRGGYGPDCAAIVQVKLTILPKSTGRADFVIGQCSGVADVQKIRQRLSPQKLDQFCDEQMRLESERASRFRVDTGADNRDRDSLINLFVKKQMYSYLIDKSGFRDNLQNDCGMALFDYPTARANFLRALGSQMPSGCVLHGFRPLNRLTYADKPAWILQAVPWLIKESGELSLLEQKVPYFESQESGTVWDHVKRAYRYLSNDLGKRGLSDQHFADWNDDLEPSAQTGARESVMVSQQLCFGLLEVAELADRIGDREVAAEAREKYRVMKDRINEVAWDGRWYVRTICEDGYPLGSARHAEARIFLNTQSWAVLSRVAEGERATSCMEAVDEFLTKPEGYAICDPPLTKFDPRIGKFSTETPGHALNGGCYSHAAGFKAVADCMLGRAEQAWQTYVRVIPGNPENPIPRSAAEPFSFQNMYEMVPQIKGQAGYPWRTGTAAWFTMALVEWILGARRGYDGLLIDPCLSKSVPHARLKRTFRGAIYHIDIDNSAGRCLGARSISVDGKIITGKTLPVFKDGQHDVKVVI
jgi:cellobiose phosphorylase